MRLLATVLLICLPRAVAAEITVTPERSAPHTPIVASLAADDVPQGAQTRLSWDVSGGQVILVNETTAHIWASPGAHSVQVTGIWVLTREVTLPDGQTFQALVDFGQVSEQATFHVGDSPGPDPLPPPPGPQRGIILEETKERTPEQFKLWSAARQALGDRLEVQDVSNLPARYKPFIDAVYSAGVSLPALVVHDGKGQVLRVIAAPKSVADIQQAMGGP